MTFQTAMMTIGHYLLLAAGLILLLLFILLAVAFILTLFMRLFADISFKTVDGQIKKKISIRFKILFYKLDLFDIDDFDDKNDAESIAKNAAENADSKSDSDKNTYHVTVTDEKISVQTTESKKSGSEYEVIVHTEETASQNIEISDDSKTIVLETPDVVSTTDDVLTYDESEAPPIEIKNETVETTEKTVIDYEFDKSESETSETSGTPVSDENVGAGEKECDSDDEDENKNADEDEDEDEDEESTLDFDELKTEIKRYVDLSDPEQFVSDSMAAAVRISKALVRLTSDLLLRIDVDQMNADIIYGLSDPANTALSFGAVHSFKASVYAYLAEVETKSKNSKKRKKAGEVGAIIRDDIHIVPDLIEKKFVADADMSFSFWIPRLYIPTLRFLLNKNTRWVIRRYLYPYFIRQYIRTWKSDRKERKAEKKQKKEKKV
ncbi:hypothetical protein MmiHf6_11620 [Methanimicrococcus hongohii]|uniref:DUF2953 domain-containing protein n=1 Tax=Methanimicrococcus hongohii TaxID=3028295 RepID=A0AA96ZSW0_9EURY|nr:DUF2953 domain-containing protein [Methanimicrococcus sp. Hf6]WNY23840.1 hypothetical protein MmiHf6_11620 [Methanimicrococcus sp. Hf6]